MHKNDTIAALGLAAVLIGVVFLDATNDLTFVLALIIPGLFAIAGAVFTYPEDAQ